MKGMKLRTKLIVIMSFIFFIVFTAQFIFQNMLFPAFYEARQKHRLLQKVESYEEAVEEERLTPSLLNEITEDHSLMVGTLDQDLIPVNGNIIQEGKFKIKTPKGEIKELFTDMFFFNDDNFQKGSKIVAQVFKDPEKQKLMVKSLDVINSDGTKNQKSSIQIVEKTTSYEWDDQEGEDISQTPKDQFENDVETYEIQGEILQYNAPHKFNVSHYLNIMDEVYKKISITDYLTPTMDVTVKEDYIMMIKYVNNQYVIGVISLTQSGEIIGLINSFNIIILLFTFLLLLCLGMYFSNKVVQPVEQMQESAKAIAVQNFSKPVVIYTGDELEDLGNALNSISQNLQDKIATLQQEYEERIEIEKKNKQLLINISHDLKTPLTVTKGYLTAIKEGIYDQEEYMDIAINSVDEVNSVITDMIELTKYQSGGLTNKNEVVDLSRLLYMSVNNLYYMSNEKQQHMLLDIEEDVFIKADQKGIKKVLQNILTNAIKYSPEQANIQISAERDNSKCTVKIENEGVHIKEEQLALIFNPFERGDHHNNSSVEGNGIGLGIVKGILDNHNFNFTLRNTKSGVCFTIVIPTIEL